MLIATFLFGWFSPSRADTVEDARLLAWTWDDRAIALSVDPPTLARLLASVEGAEATLLSTAGGEYHRYALPDQALDGVAVGSAWRLLAPSGERRCAVTGLGMITATVGSLEAEAPQGGAPCMRPLVFADIDCGEGELPWDAIAVPADSAARMAQAGEPVAVQTPTGPLAAVLRDEAIRAVRADAAAAAAGDYLKTELTATTYTLGSQEIVAVEGRFWTGEGEDFCGGEDVSSEWGGLLLGGAPAGMHAMPDGRIQGVLDLDGDGAPEVLERDIYGAVLRGADGEVIRRQDEEWCVCGC